MQEQNEEHGSQILLSHLAGAAGFEPANDGTKNRCLTAWPRPIGRKDYSEDYCLRQKGDL
jgi:hypothetical protein